MPAAELIEGAISTAATDPEWFLRNILRDKYVYPKQVEMLRAIARYPRVSVVGCNSSGKDFTSARAIITHLSTYYPSKALVFGPSARQVSEIVFREMRDAYDNAFKHGNDLGGEMYRKAPRWQIDNRHFALGFATDVAFNLTGFHSPNLFVVITEAHAMDQAHINKIKTLHPKKILMTGNPFAEYGEFWESHHSKRHLWKTIQISAYDTPNVIEGREVIPGLVTLDTIQAARDDWGEENPLFIASILGLFPDALTDSVVALSYAVAATQRLTLPEGAKIAACDVSRFGTAKTVLCERQGMFSRFVWKHQGKATTETEGKLKLYLDENPDVGTLFIDDTGIGGGITDHLVEDEKYRARVVPFVAGEDAQNKKRFANATTEAWWAMREAYMVGGLRTPDDQALVSQVVSRKYKILSDKRLRLESKEDMHGKGTPSPDEGDSLAMTFAKRPPQPNLIIIDTTPQRDEASPEEIDRAQREAEERFLRGDDLED